MNKKPLRSYAENLSIKKIYVGEIDTTYELDVGGASSARDFYKTYYVRNEEDLKDFIAGRKFFVYGQKGAGKTAFLRYVGERLTREREVDSKYSLYRFARDFPEQAHRDLTGYISKKRTAEGAVIGENFNVFRDIDYEDFWTFIILERVDEFLQNEGRGMVANDRNLAEFRKMVSTIERGSIQARFLRLKPKPQSAKIDLSIKPSATIDFSFTESSQLEHFSQYVQELLAKFTRLNWIAGFVNFMFDEIDPRVGSGKAFDLDCILIRDLIVVIHKLNTPTDRGERRFVFSAAVRSEVLKSVEKLGKEVHKRLSQLGIHMNWGEYGRSDEENPLIKMLCKKIAYSEQLEGFYVHSPQNTDTAIYRKYFCPSDNEAVPPKRLLNLTWHNPRDIVRLLKIAKAIDGDAKHFGLSLIDRSKTTYAKEAWQEIQSQLIVALSPEGISAVDILLTRFFTEFSRLDLEKQLRECSLMHRSVEELTKEHRIGELISILYSNGIIGNKEGTIHRWAFRGDDTPDMNSGFVLHPGLYKRFAPRKKELPDRPVGEEEFDFGNGD